MQIERRCRADNQETSRNILSNVAGIENPEKKVLIVQGEFVF